MSKILEITRFIVDPSHQEEFLAKRTAAVDALRTHVPGFLDAQLGHVAGGLWIDVLEWESRKQATAAGVTAESLPEVQVWAGYIDEFLSFERADVQHTCAEPADRRQPSPFESCEDSY